MTATTGVTAANKALAKLRRIMPAGSKTESWSGKTHWDRRGGYAGERSIRATIAKAAALGFTWVDARDLSVPDGSTIGSGQYYRDAAGNVLYTSTRYGGVAADNSYRLELTPAEPFPGRCTQAEPHGRRCQLDAGHAGGCDSESRPRLTGGGARTAPQHPDHVGETAAETMSRLGRGE